MSSDATPAATTTPPAWWHGPVAGTLAGVASRIVVYPADTLKARLQVAGTLRSTTTASTTTTTSTLGAARALFVAEGAAGFYRGLGAVLAGAVPANLMYFGGYEAAKAALSSSDDINNIPPALADAAAGAAAQLLAGAVYTPVDVVKERLQVASAMGPEYPAFRGAAHALRAAAGGGAAGLLRGYWVTNAVWLPWNVLYVSGYEATKRAARAALDGGNNAELPSWAVAGCSASAAAAAAAATHPADVVKTRLQVLTATDAGRGLSAAGVARGMWAREGARAFWAGLGARVLNIAPGCALSWALYESLKPRVGGVILLKD